MFFHICLCCLVSLCPPALTSPLQANFRGLIETLRPWGAEKLLWVGIDAWLFPYRRVILSVEWENGCHGTLTCTPQVNILESMLPFRVPFPKGKVDRRLRRQVWEAAIGLSKREGIKFAKLDHLCADVCVCVCVSVCLSPHPPFSQKPQSVWSQPAVNRLDFLRPKRRWTQKWHVCFY